MDISLSIGGSSCLHWTDAAQIPNPAPSNAAGKTQPRRSRRAEPEPRSCLLPPLQREVPERERIKQTPQWCRIKPSGTIWSSGLYFCCAGSERCHLAWVKGGGKGALGQLCHQIPEATRMSHPQRESGSSIKPRWALGCPIVPICDVPRALMESRGNIFCSSAAFASFQIFCQAQNVT